MALNEHQRRGSLARGDEAANVTPNTTNPTNTNTATNKSQPSTPTSPVVDASHIAAQRGADFTAHPQHRQVVYFANGRPVAQGAPPAAAAAPTAMYDQTGATYPMHMYQGVAYATYPVNGAPADPTTAAAAAAPNAASTPTVQPQQRPQAPGILTPHYNAVPQQQQQPRAAAPQQHHQMRAGHQNHNNPRARFMPGIIPNPRPANNALYLPVANGNQAAMLIAGQYAAAQMNSANMYHMHDGGYRHTDNKTGAGCLADPQVGGADYGKMGGNMAARNMIQVNQNRGPVIQFQPTYQTYQAYITHPQR